MWVYEFTNKSVYLYVDVIVVLWRKVDCAHRNDKAKIKVGASLDA